MAVAELNTSNYSRPKVSVFLFSLAIGNGGSDSFIVVARYAFTSETMNSFSVCTTSFKYCSEFSEYSQSSMHFQWNVFQGRSSAHKNQYVVALSILLQFLRGTYF